MRKILLVIFFLIEFLRASAQEKERKFRLPVSVTTKDYLQGVIIIKLKSSEQKSVTVKRNADFPALNLSSGKIISVKNKFPDIKSEKSADTRVVKQDDKFGLNRIYELKYIGSSKIEEVISEILKNEEVEYAEPRYIHRITYSPNDPSYIANNQTYLNQIKAPQAWDFTRNASSVVIGIVDSGSDLDHPDLAPNILLNPADPVNGIDDDGDSYVDNYAGWDLVGASGLTPIPDNNPNVTNSGADHGVHVSGIASAVSDNGIGVASVAYNAKLLIVKASADDDGSTIYAGYEGIKYAADHGAHIINCSWGGPGGGAFGQDMVNYALSRGCLIVAAAGNSGSTIPDYPAAYPGVIAVANILDGDLKNPSSNYGSHVTISAPGTNIYSTAFNNTYKYDSGTSMAAPVVSGAAALVKAYSPMLNMHEVGEKLRATADNIDGLNPAFAGKLGRGRLNVYRALTENPPSVRNQHLTVIDKGNGSRQAGETLELYFDLKNFLAPANGLTLTLNSPSPYVTIRTAEVTVGTLGAGEIKTRVGPFLVMVNAGAPNNAEIVFRLNYSANMGGYSDFESFILTVALDYINYNINQIATTATSTGRVGYSDANASQGQGFIYKNQSLLYEASLMIGNSPYKVSSNVRSATGKSDEHFVKKVSIKTIQNTPEAWITLAEFDDGGSPQPLNVYVKHRHLAFPKAPDDKYIITEYTVINKGTAPFLDIYVGLFTDWDIDNASNNVTEYDEANRMGYTYSKNTAAAYTGVKLLSKSASPAYYPLSYSIPGDPLETEPFTIAEKFQTLSSGIKAKELGKSSSTGYDVMYVIGSGPYTIPVNDSVKVAFAFIGGDNLNDIKNSAMAAQDKYDELVIADAPEVTAVRLKNYPNPTKDFTTIQFSVPQKGDVSLGLYTASGKKVKSIIANQKYQRGIYNQVLDLSGLDNGIYICKFWLNNVEKSVKISLIK